MSKCVYLKAALASLLVVAGSANARFVSVDPVQANPNNGANFNRYHYANNNPYKFTDPDGRASYVFWYGQNKAVVVIPYAVSDSQGVAAFTNEQVNATIQNAYSGSVTLDGAKVDVIGVGLPVPLNDESRSASDVNIVEVNPSTERSSTDRIGGNRIDLRGTADAAVVTHELGHTAGAGDQYPGGVAADGTVLPDNYETTNSIMGTAAGKANRQTLREVITAPSATHQCMSTGEPGRC